MKLQKAATKNCGCIVQNLWRMKILCGRRWKSEGKLLEDSPAVAVSEGIAGRVGRKCGAMARIDSNF